MNEIRVLDLEVLFDKYGEIDWESMIDTIDQQMLADPFEWSKTDEGLYIGRWS
ncbi:MAG: hypothetical protein II695_06945 [Oscillospiraceae bacterium]|jgi:hypothetical protein|nr:hypothetical protein [Oscillospiraceae bacterium]